MERSSRYTAPIDRRQLLRAGGAALAGTLSWPAKAAVPAAGGRISVSAARAQRFDGFGLSQPRGDRTFAQLPADGQSRALDMAYKELPVRFFRAWVRSHAALDVPLMLDDFRQSYLDNGMLAKISARCHPGLILAPGTRNEGVKVPAADYARKIAGFIAALKAETGLTFEATGIDNEPEPSIPVSYIADTAVALRKELDGHGLQTTQVIAADWANADGWSIAAIKALESDPRANAAIHAWSMHSYNMASTRVMALAARNKQRWVTEAGQSVSDVDAPQALVNVMDAPTLAARILTDLNQGVSRWMYFIGMRSELSQVGKGQSRHALVQVSASGEVFAFNRYFYLKQLLATFPRGSVCHPCSSSLDGAMDWTFGRRPRLSAACVQAPDGSVRLAAVNTTGIVDTKLAQYFPAQTIALEFDAPWSNATFEVHVTGTDGTTRSAGTTRLGIGQAPISLEPFEMATLTQVR